MIDACIWGQMADEDMVRLDKRLELLTFGKDYGRLKKCFTCRRTREYAQKINCGDFYVEEKTESGRQKATPASA